MSSRFTWVTLWAADLVSSCNSAKTCHGVMSRGMTHERWKLTKDAITGEPKIDAHGDLTVMRDEPISILAELAKDPANGLEQIASGIYRGPKAP
jgi:hypothetical protein